MIGQSQVVTKPVMLAGFSKILVAPAEAEFGGHPLTIVISAVAFWALFGFLQYSGWLVPKNHGLKEADILEWNISKLPPRGSTAFSSFWSP